MSFSLSVCRHWVPPLFGAGDAGLPVHTVAGPAELEHGPAAASEGRIWTGSEPRQRRSSAGPLQHLFHASSVPLSAS